MQWNKNQPRRHKDSKKRLGAWGNRDLRGDGNYIKLSSNARLG
jgi:hypothetical protein